MRTTIFILIFGLVQSMQLKASSDYSTMSRQQLVEVIKFERDISVLKEITAYAVNTRDKSAVLALLKSPVIGARVRCLESLPEDDIKFISSIFKDLLKDESVWKYNEKLGEEIAENIVFQEKFIDKMRKAYPKLKIEKISDTQSRAEALSQISKLP